MADDRTIPTLTDLIERGDLEDDLSIETESTELLTRVEPETDSQHDLLIDASDDTLQHTEISAERYGERPAGLFAEKPDNRPDGSAGDLLQDSALTFNLPDELEESTDIDDVDGTELRNYDNIEEGVETENSSVDFLVESKQPEPAVEDFESLRTQAQTEDELDAELEQTIQRIIDRHMDQAMHEIRLALQIRKR